MVVSWPLPWLAVLVNMAAALPACGRTGTAQATVHHAGSGTLVCTIPATMSCSTVSCVNGDMCVGVSLRLMGGSKQALLLAHRVAAPTPLACRCIQTCAGMPLHSNLCRQHCASHTVCNSPGMLLPLSCTPAHQCSLGPVAASCIKEGLHLGTHHAKPTQGAAEAQRSRGLVHVT